MSKSENAPITNAGEVIERFGGIRPMAKKIDVAVTTIQGWKKRDVIPAARYKEILQAAAQHNVDLSDLVKDAPPVNQNVKDQASSSDDTGVLQGAGRQLTDDKPAAEKTQEPKEDASIVLSVKPSEKPAASASVPESGEHPALKHRMTASVWVHLILGFLAILALGMLLFTGKIDINQGSPALAPEPEKSEHSFLGPLIPKNLDAQIAALKEQAGQAQEALSQVATKAQEISNDVMAEDAGTIEQRVAKLQTHMAELAATPELQNMMSRVQSWTGQQAGQERLDQASAEIAALISALGDQMIAQEGTFESALQTVRQNNVAVNQTFEGVPQDDLKAAAMLLGMSQFRSSLGRDNKPFDDDLQVMMGLIGEDQPELKSSLERLAPYAKEGVLTPDGLSRELKEMTGEAVVASLKGEDVSISERAKAKINEVFQVQKDGELVSGTDTQARMDKAQKLMDAGDIEGAIAQVQSLDGPAAQVAQPWINQAQASLMAQKAQNILTQALSGMGSVTSGSRYIHNEETGITIMKKDPVSSIGDAVRDANPYSDQ